MFFRSSSNAAAWFALITIGLAWGGTQILSKIIVQGGHHPIGITLTGTVLGAVVLTVMMSF